MCVCGRKRSDGGAVTSVQAAQEAQDMVRRIEEQTVRDVEAYTRSAANAVGNSSSN